MHGQSLGCDRGVRMCLAGGAPQFPLRSPSLGKNGLGAQGRGRQVGTESRGAFAEEEPTSYHPGADGPTSCS